jgi:hypothetical protein
MHSRTAITILGIEGSEWPMANKAEIALSRLDDDHVRAVISWSESDAAGGTLVMTVTVENPQADRKPEDQIRADAKGLAMRMARAFSHKMEN